VSRGLLRNVVRRGAAPADKKAPARLHSVETSSTETSMTVRKLLHASVATDAYRSNVRQFVCCDVLLIYG
jgi:hypothetical protein